MSHRLGRTSETHAPRPEHVLCLLLVGLACLGCRADQQDPSTTDGPQTDTLSYYEDGAPKQIAVRQGDSVLERRYYRTTGRVEKIKTDDSVRTYFDLHDPDSADVLQDYLQGHWRNLAADTSQARASAFYIFDDEQLTFESPDRTMLESLGVEYENDRTLVTDDGMSVEATIISFDTVHVTGYTLVRTSPPDSL